MSVPGTPLLPSPSASEVGPGSGQQSPAGLPLSLVRARDSGHRVDDGGRVDEKWARLDHPSHDPAPISCECPRDPASIARGGHGWESCRHYPNVGSSQALINRSLPTRGARRPALIIRSRAPHPHASRYGVATPLRQSCMYPPSGEGGGPPHVPSRMDIAMRAERWAASQTGPVFFT